MLNGANRLVSLLPQRNLDKSEWCPIPSMIATGGSAQDVAAPPASQASDLQLLLRQQQEVIMALTLPQPDVPIFGSGPIGYCDFI